MIITRTRAAHDGHDIKYQYHAMPRPSVPANGLQVAILHDLHCLVRHVSVSRLTVRSAEKLTEWWTEAPDPSVLHTCMAGWIVSHPCQRYPRIASNYLRSRACPILCSETSAAESLSHHI